MNVYEEARYEVARYHTRRHFLKQCMSGLGALTVGSFLGCRQPETMPATAAGSAVLRARTHLPPRARHVIFMHMSGAPSHLELFDYKPTLAQLDGQPCPPSLLAGKRFAFLKNDAKLLGPRSTFAQHGESGAWVSDYLPTFATIADEVTFLKAMHTDEFNHAPAQFLLHTGSGRMGRPSIGAWAAYGLGTENADLPAFVVLLSGNWVPSAGKSVWGSGFLPTVYQGVHCQASGEAVLNLSNPDGIDETLRKHAIETITAVNQQTYQEIGDPEILSRISQYELAFRMQTSVPETFSFDDEPAYIHDLYGTEPGQNTFANNCLLARKLVEKGVRFVQLFDNRWDTHGVGKDDGVGLGLRRACQAVDRPMTALLMDLKQRGLLDETLVVWGGEFGRTPMMEERIGKGFDGRDHNSDAFTIWMAGGGIRRGYTHGETDEIGYTGRSGRVHIHDLQATLLYALGLDHERLIYRFQGRDFRLTDVHGKVVHEILA